MALQTPSMIGDGGHGLKGFGYRVEFASPPKGQTFPDLAKAQWTQRLVKLLKVTKAYGARDQTAELSTWDPDAISTDTLQKPTQWLKEPVNGEGVRVWL